MNGRNLVFVYARSDSVRLPGKPFFDLGGRALIDIVCARSAVLSQDGIVLLTTERKVDDALASHGEALGLSVVRGDAFDLVQRTLQAIELQQVTRFLRVNADSPLFEPSLAELALNWMIKSEQKVAMTSNLFRRRFPYGVAVEWVDAGFYAATAGSALPNEREHVTQHLYRVAGEVPALSLEQGRNDSWIRLTVDTLEDLEKMRALAKRGNMVSDSYWEFFGLSEPEDPFRVMIT